MDRITTLFTAHPASVDESFGEHFLFATRFSGLLFAAAGAALVHAILPFLFQKTASQIVAKLYDRTHNRGA
ncbi:hypothetical protein G5B40_05360 [Pikeienuella piscinae]|uniref:Capsule biosynthesis protein n=1 Tax=Pikeienuella piscinae TaxID=2748098 RepID=A0A7L5BXF1_9RHOB|nr:DUF6356 family protein [Pikeienuella piscinae]QIE54926.1 hypothetical protein G5B40_05360 [Pikeienuella piscinae]